MHIGAPCCGMNAAVRYSTFCFWKDRAKFELKKLFSDHSPGTASTLGTTLLESTMEWMVLSRFCCLIILNKFVDAE